VRHFHVTSSLNRESIRRFGLDWTRMGAASGIAGSTVPEVEGIFLDELPDFFVRMNNTGGPVDVWAVDGIEPESLVEGSNGFPYFPGVIGSEQLTLLETDVAPPDWPSL
jgi:hypothetical protein